MKKKFLKNQKGFSLLEALIAMLILTTGLLAVGLMQIGAMQGNTNAISRSDGNAVAQTVMDALRSVPVDDPMLTASGNNLDSGIATSGNPPTPGNADHTGDELFGVNPTPGANGNSYTVFWNVLDDSPVDNAKTVRVFVYWTDRKYGTNKSIMTSVIGGLYL